MNCSARQYPGGSGSESNTGETNAKQMEPRTRSHIRWQLANHEPDAYSRPIHVNHTCSQHPSDCDASEKPSTASSNTDCNYSVHDLRRQCKPVARTDLRTRSDYNKLHRNPFFVGVEHRRACRGSTPARVQWETCLVPVRQRVRHTKPVRIKTNSPLPSHLESSK